MLTPLGCHHHFRAWVSISYTPAMTQATPATSALRQRRYPYLIAIPRACFTANLWRDVRQNWRGIGMLYMLLLLAITWAITCTTPLRSFHDFLEVDAPRLIRQVPPIVIQDGVVYVDAPEHGSVTGDCNVLGVMHR